MPELPNLHGLLRSAYAGRRVLVTGHTGFKGGWLSLWLTQLGAEVHGVSLAEDPQQSLFASIRLDELVDHRVADIRDAEGYFAVTHGIEPDIVIHMAAQSLVRPSYADPLATFSTNVVGTATVLEAVRKSAATRAVIVVSSDKCYENNEWYWPYREVDPMGGADPYSASKGCTELVASCYRRSFFNQPDGCQLASVRAGNVFGGGDWSVDRLVPDIVRANLSRQPVCLRNPSSVRPWQHVLEPLSGYLMLGARLLSDDAVSFAEGWNFGPDAAAFVEVASLARGMQNAWGEEAAPIVIEPRAGEPHEASMLTLDSSKAHARLGWRPRLSAQEAIEMTADWYRAYANGRQDMREFTARQIAAYAGEEGRLALVKEESRICA